VTHARTSSRALTLAAFSLLICTLSACRGPSVLIAVNGKAHAVIVIAEDAPKPVQFAGQELRTHLNAMTGGNFKIVGEAPELDSAILLGDTPTAREAGIDASKIARDGYVVKSVGNRIYIVGRDDPSPRGDVRAKLDAIHPKAGFQGLKKAISPDVWAFERGTLYGTYRFLEELGVR